MQRIELKAKTFDSSQPAQSAQADLSRYFFADTFSRPFHGACNANSFFIITLPQIRFSRRLAL